MFVWQTCMLSCTPLPASALAPVLLLVPPCLRSWFMCLPPVASPALESAFACMTWDYDSFECEELYDTKTHK